MVENNIDLMEQMKKDDNVFEYVLKAERNSDNNTIFYIKHMDNAKLIELSKRSLIYSSKGKIIGCKIFESILGHNLIGWKNLKTKDGVDIAFTKENIDKIPFRIIQELIEAMGYKNP